MHFYGGNFPMTIKEIAKLAGVSISTVSKIVNNKDENITPQTRSRVLQIVKEYNYTPYGTVKNISNTKKFILGVLLRTTSRAALIIGGILKKAQEHGYTILLLDSQASPTLERRHINTLISNGVDGVLWEPVAPESCESKQFFDRQGIPCCLIGTKLPFPAYSIDFSRMGYMLTEELIRCRHTSLACLLKENSRRSEALFEGFQKCLFDHQIPLTDDMKLYLTQEHCSQEIMRHKITGIVSSHFSLSLGLYKELERLHYHIPSDLSLVSLKDGTQDLFSCPHISGIQVPYFSFGQYVMRQLIRLCEKSADDDADTLFFEKLPLDGTDSISQPISLRAKHFVVVGAINMDVTFNVDELPRYGKTTNIINSTTTAGGKGVNQAVGLARLGHEVALIGETGSDADGSFLIDTLENFHVQTTGVHRSEREPTGKAYIYTAGSGESAISLLTGANGGLTPDDVEHHQHLFSRACYCLISTEIPMETVIRAAELARQYGCITILKPPMLTDLPEELCKNIDILVPNRQEACALCPIYDTVQEQAEYFLQSGIKTVIITLGHDGCYLRTAEKEAFFPVSMDFLPVDTTAGADAFIAALASYLTRGCTLEEAIRIATCAAGFCISRQGTVHALVDKNTLETYMAKKRLPFQSRK